MTVDTALEEELARSFQPQMPSSTALQPSFVRRVLDCLKRMMGDQVTMATPILLCGSPARFHLRRLLEPFLPKVVVLSPGEIPRLCKCSPLES